MKNILFAPETPPPVNPPAIAKLQAQLDAANKQIADLQSAAAQRSADETEIVKKMAKGLTRAQAIAVINRQRDYDRTPVAIARKAAKPGDTIQERQTRYANAMQETAAKKS